MSRFLELTITVSNHDDSKHEAIVDAVSGLGYDADADTFGVGRGSLLVFNSEQINVSRSDEELASEIHEAVWKANEAFCKVNVELRDLDAECPSYEGEEADYERML